MKTFQTAFCLCATTLSALCLTAELPQAGVGDQFNKLLADDGTSGDRFGASVAISGTTVIAGARFDAVFGINSGSAYLFNTATGLQIADLLPSDGSSGDQFGHSVALSGTTAIVGARFDDDNGGDSGSVYLFDTTTGLQLAKLLPNDGAAGDRFGTSVAISGTLALVGAQADDDNGSDSGSAYLFDTTTGLQLAKLLPSDGAAGDKFGSSVSLTGTTAMVGARFDDDNGTDSGSAYLFDTSTGMQTFKLLPGDGAAGDGFGKSVAISGTAAVVGAQFDGDNGLGSGSAYLFDSASGLQLAKLLSDDGAAGDNFGISVAVSGMTVVVGARLDDDNGSDSGSAYLFDSTSGLQIAKLLSSDGANADRFGESVAISGAAVVVGTSFDDDNGPESGSAYIFEAPSPVSLTSDLPSISLSTGGSQVLALDGGALRAGSSYFMFGSVTGTTPGLDFGGGVVLPLNFDLYFNLTLKSPGLAIFGNFRSTLDGSGQAVATLSLPALMDMSLVGITLNHAYVAAAVFGTPDFASNAVPVTLVP